MFSPCFLFSKIFQWNCGNNCFFRWFIYKNLKTGNSGNKRVTQFKWKPETKQKVLFHAKHADVHVSIFLELERNVRHIHGTLWLNSILCCILSLNVDDDKYFKCRYVTAGTSWLTGAFSKVAKAGNVAGTKTREKFNMAVSNLTTKVGHSYLPNHICLLSFQLKF